MMLQRKRSLNFKQWLQHAQKCSASNEEEEAKIIIPGLPNEIATQCLIRVPRMYHRSMKSVSRAWGALFRSRDFFAARSSAGHTDAWLLVLVSDLLQKSPSSLTFCAYDLASRSLLCRRSLDHHPHCQESHESHHNLVEFRTAAVENRFIVVESRCGFRTALENHTRIYNCISESWECVKSPKISRSGFSMAAVDHTVLIAGGFNSDGEFESVTEALDLITGEWSFRAPIPLELDRVDAEVVFQKKVYIRAFQAESHRAVMLVYDTSNDSWEERAEMSSMDRGELVATDLGIFCLSTDELYKFDSDSGSWISVLPLGFNFNVHSQRAFGKGDEIFILGGNPPNDKSGDGVVSVSIHGLFADNSWQSAGSIVTV